MIEFNSPFIKAANAFDINDEAFAPAPIFRKKFILKKSGKATLRFCGLGYGYAFINGKNITEDLLTAPVSDYGKLLWYSEYDVSSLLNKGENIIAVILGNGFFNENFPSAWDTNKAYWRDNPKFAAQLIIDDELILESDESFKCIETSFVTYNQLRSGETFNAGLYDENWKNLDYCENGFKNAVLDEKTKGIPRKKVNCEPIRECEEYDFISCTKTDEGYLLDFGINSSGYVKAYLREAEGAVIEFHQAEQIYDDNTLNYNGLGIYYPTVDFQVDRYICGKKPYLWSPKFTYHGFRYVLVKGLTRAPEKNEIKAIFVHQDIKRRADFNCSNELLNKIYNAGIRSVYSNLHYALTDCPTREKLGWTNDAQATLEQIYINFRIEKFMEKWGTDILFSQDAMGAIPAIIPSNGWGFGMGPVADGILFEIPYIEYLYTGSDKKLIEFLPYLLKYYDGFISDKFKTDYWLGDWDGAKNRFYDYDYIVRFYQIKFCKTIILALQKSGIEDTSRYEKDIIKAENYLRDNFIDENGKSVIDNQTVIAMLLSLNIADSKPLCEQLKKRVEADNFHITSGMLGIQYIYDALTENGLGEYAYRLITAKGSPSYENWFADGATTLWETWENGKTDSKNHHMFSNVLAWFHKYLLGIKPQLSNAGFKEINLTPVFIKDLDFCEGSIDTVMGKISVCWVKTDKAIEYTVTIPEGITAYYNKIKLNTGENLIRYRLK